MKNYIVYRTENLINNKFYYGVLKTDQKRAKGYLGSGKWLFRAVKKYGKENFIRRTIMEFDNKEEAYNFEGLIVDQSLVANVNCYNLCLGGSGGNRMIGERTSEYREKMKIATAGCKNGMYGKKHNDETKKKISDKLKGKLSGSKNPRWNVYSIKQQGEFLGVLSWWTTKKLLGVL